MRTKIEIDAEVIALKALKPVGPFAKNTKAKIDLALEEIEHGYDDTSGEWDELSDVEQDIVMTARHWKESDSDDKPSEGWGELVE